MANIKTEITKAQRNKVKKLAEKGCTWKQIASQVGVAERTLQRHCVDEFKQGKEIVGEFVVGKLMELIQNGHPASIMFYCKTQLGWKETNKPRLLVRTVDLLNQPLYPMKNMKQK